MENRLSKRDACMRLWVIKETLKVYQEVYMPRQRYCEVLSPEWDIWVTSFPLNIQQSLQKK